MRKSTARLQDSGAPATGSSRVRDSWFDVGSAMASQRERDSDGKSDTARQRGSHASCVCRDGVGTDRTRQVGVTALADQTRDTVLDFVLHLFLVHSCEA